MENNINLIAQSGKELGFGWYEYDGVFYRIFNDQILIRTNDLNINVEEQAFAYRAWLSQPNMTTVVIGNYVGIVQSPPATIEMYKDGYYIHNTTDGRHRELKSGDVSLVKADEIKRIKEGFLCISDGVYYLYNGEEVKMLIDDELKEMGIM